MTAIFDNDCVERTGLLYTQSKAAEKQTEDAEVIKGKEEHMLLILDLSHIDDSDGYDFDSKTLQAEQVKSRREGVMRRHVSG